MPRKSTKTIEERIAEIDTDIKQLEERKSKLNEKTNELSKRREDLVKEQQFERFHELQSIMEENGISPEEVIKRITEQK